MTGEEIEKKPWYTALSAEVRLLVDEAVALVEQAERLELGEGQDYSFLVFPAAKAYEGFLKSYFFQMGMVGRGAVMDDHFRIGKALNPDIPKRHRDNDWLYDDVSEACGREVADFLWQAWRRGRNRVFHFRHEEDNMLSFERAVEKVGVLFEAMEKAEECGVRLKDEGSEKVVK